MNENRYTRTVDSIKAPKESVQKMLDAVHSYEKKEKIIHMSTLKKSVIAASLAVAIILTAVFGIPALSPKTNPFTLTVNAAEVTDREFTAIGTLDTIGGDFQTTERSGQVIMTEFFEFNVKVESNNIDHILYTVEGGQFGINGEGGELLDQMYQSDIVTEEMDDKNFTCLHIRADSFDTTLPDEVRQAVRAWNDHANVKLGEPTLQPDYDDSRFNIADCKKTIYTALLDRLKVDVAITLTDGKTIEKTLVFTCDSVEQETGIATISAKLE